MYTSRFDWTPLSTTNNNKVTILNAATGATVGSYISKSESVFSASWSPDGRFIATSESTNNHNQIVVWTV
jgi:WD40 repeat protein